jgi:hypothetical protein
MKHLAITCDPNGLPSRESFAAHLAEGRRLLAASLERRELADGWALRLSNDDETFASVARWTVGERQCCPFLRFVLDREAGEGAFWVRMTGPDGTREALAAVSRIDA